MIMNLFKVPFISWCFLLVFLGINHNLAYANNCEEDYKCIVIEDDDERAICVDNKIACYQKKIDNSKNQQKTLSGELSYIDNRIRIQEMQIEKTRLDIVRAKKEAEVLSSRIDNLSESMEKLAEMLTTLIAQSYKSQHVSNLEIFLANENFTAAVNKKQSGEIANLHTSKILFRSMEEKLDFNVKLEEREKLQIELEKKTQQLKTQQANLEKQKEEKAILLAQTKNDEKTYQRLMEEARKEAEAFRRFAASTGGSSCLGSSPGDGSNGWFYSQRDPRWCRQYIGGSKMTVGEVGCYITAVTMVHRKTGSSLSPSIFAANKNYFFSNTALMTTPPAPTGYTYKRYDYFKTELIDDELRAGRPVVVHVRTNNGYGGHFIVLISGEGGNYQMHDPWHGPDLNFNRYYSTGIITSLRIFTQ